MKANRVFVYGSLKQGFWNHPRFMTSARLVGTARTVDGFTLFDNGRYPKLEANGDRRIHGEVYEVDSQTLTALDRLECGYDRVPINVDLTDGDRTEAFVYLGKGETAGWHRLESDCWPCPECERSNGPNYKGRCEH